MIAPDGTEWLPIADAAKRVRVRISTIRNWASRGKVESVRVLGRTWVSMDDVTESELAWRLRRVSIVQRDSRDTF